MFMRHPRAGAELSSSKGGGLSRLLVHERLPGGHLQLYVNGYFCLSFVSSLTAPTFWPFHLLLWRGRILR